MWNYLAPLFSLSFWFNIQPIPFLPWAENILLAVFALLVVGGLVLSVTAKRQPEKQIRRLWRRAGAVSIAAGLVGFLLYEMTIQRISIFSMRFFFLIWFVGFGWYAWTQIIRHVRALPILRAEQAEREAYEKWLPKSKKKKE